MKFTALSCYIKGIFLILILFTGLCFAENLIRLDNSAFDSPQRPGAVFDHDEHNFLAGLEDDCALCHHVYEDGILVENESSEDSLCSDCHGLKASPDNPVALREAFHDRCKTCHFEQKKGPVLCGECHVKE